MTKGRIEFPFRIGCWDPWSPKMDKVLFAALLCGVDQPRFRYLAASSGASLTLLAGPGEREFTSCGCGGRNVELLWNRRPGALHIGVNLELLICNQAHLFCRVGAAVNNSQTVMRLRVQTGVMHF